MEADNIIEPDTAQPKDSLVDRNSLCLPNYDEDSVLHGGDPGFKDVLRRYFPSPESNAMERLVALKGKLRTADTHDFWGILMEEMCDIMDSQCGFVAKRILVNDATTPVEMPEYGESGSCLMGVAVYLNNGVDFKELYRDYRYHAYGTPCAHMRHDKVFIVPERLSEFVPNNPNKFPWERSEAYIGVPLFANGKCFAHFGMIWSSEGAGKRMLSWSFIEMFLHSLEDMILQRILEGRGFVKEPAPPGSSTAKVIPLAAVTASQSLKPYARSLSHELRTPMQGVVGMLDIMYSTVVDAIESQESDLAHTVFTDLKKHIEVVQESSKRAVEAADNVVHAYDLNMQMPDTPLTPVGSEVDQSLSVSQTAHVDYGSGLSSPLSRKRDRIDSASFHPGPPLKKMYTMTELELLPDYDRKESHTRFVPQTILPLVAEAVGEPEAKYPSSMSRTNSPIIAPAVIGPTHKRIVTRDFMRNLVTEALKSRHPIMVTERDTETGKVVEVKTLGSRGEVQEQTVYLDIDPDVPEAVVTEEQHLQFSLQKVVDNAIKFTESGSISISMKMGKGLQVVDIWVVDTGCGIAEESRSSLFKPHFQEDASRHRAKDGLGLSLFNAKAHVRRNLGGDVTLERSATEGPSKGSEFLIRLPFSGSTTHTPLVGTPTLTPNEQSFLRAGAWNDPIASPSYFPPEVLVLPSTPASEQSPPRQVHTQHKRKSSNPSLAKDCPLNILIAEDNQINRNVALACLNKLGYKKENITLAFDGIEVVQKYTASLSKPVEEQFDCVLMDIWMPNMDGYEATKKILDLALKHGQATKIIAVTADITSESVDRAKEAGMQGFLAKPYKVLDIENLILGHFGHCGH
ncbi:HHK17, histidine kinase-group VII protein [Bisporella sp. PMI_857]|nr:HHK17, histidine kinase-group VII protein [Bisporella sp. PMI_857]